MNRWDGVGEKIKTGNTSSFYVAVGDGRFVEGAAANSVNRFGYSLYPMAIFALSSFFSVIMLLTIVNKLNGNIE